MVPAGGRPPPAAWCGAAVTQPLTKRQTEIADLLVDGLTQQGIADRLHISKSTVKDHIYGSRRHPGLYARLGVETRLDATVWAYHQREHLDITHFMDQRRDERAKGE